LKAPMPLPVATRINGVDKNSFGLNEEFLGMPFIKMSFVL